MKLEELDAVCALGGTDWLANVVRGMWNDGRSTPEQCFVVEHEGRPVGRVFFHDGPGSGKLAMFGDHVDQSADFLETGRAMLGAALARLKATGATGVEHAIYDIYDPNPARQRELIEAVGFRQYQETKRYAWKDAGTAVEPPARLEFRPFAVVGEDVFTDAVARVTEGTLDRDDMADIARLGLQEAGPRYMAILKQLDFRPDEWLLGYVAGGALCGLVVPQRLDDKEGCINYIGVVPELRGSGYGFDLLVKGTAMLQQRGFKVVVAETDSENRPFHSELERAGFRHHGTMRCFRCDLAQSSGVSADQPARRRDVPGFF
jgi:ribosomal protein S18 acetylase RimI-like enzyme